MLTAGHDAIDILLSNETRDIDTGNNTVRCGADFDEEESNCDNKLEFYIKTKPRDRDPFDDTANNSSSQDSNKLCLSLLERLEVEFELFSFEYISVTSATLTRARRNAS